jgi:hypothetical protein
MGDSLSIAIDDRAASALGVAAILTKPLDLDILVQHVEQIAGPPA